MLCHIMMGRHQVLVLDTYDDLYLVATSRIP
jgi:hypothetical protein